MDKYTVDIDKVLNDFEYSERTSQYDKPPTAPPPSFKFPTTPVKKHSITNVFSSLQEYVNSDIGNKDDTVAGTARAKEANKYRVETTARSEALYLESVRKDVPPRSFENEEPENSTGFLENELPQNFTCLEEERGSASCPILLPEAPDVLQQSNLPQSNPTTQNLESASASLDILQPLTDQPARSSSPEFVEPNFQALDILQPPNGLENVSQQSPDLHDEMPDLTLVDTNENCLATAADSESVETPVRKHSETSIPPDLIQVEEADGLNSDPTLQNNSTETSESVEPTSVVGFETVTIDDSDLNRYLDELEEEFESKPEESGVGSEAEVASQKSEAKEVETAGPNSEGECAGIHKTEGEGEDGCSSASRPKSLSITSETTIDRIGEPGSTPYNNVYITKELEHKRPDTDSESSTSASPTFSDMSSESTASTESIADAVPPSQSAQSQPPENDVSVETPQEEAKDDEAMDQSEEVGENEAAGISAAIERSGSGGDVAGSSAAYSGSCLEVTSWLGKQAPLWIPDSEALNCLHCDTKFTVIKRRHHCRACGLVLCSKCCNEKVKYRLEYLDAEARVCQRCHGILSARDTNGGSSGDGSPAAACSSPDDAPPPPPQPNPNNPMEYCSMVPPHQQVSGAATGAGQSPPTVMVPVGVLKRNGSGKSRTNKSVMFCDGIRPGSELTNLDTDFNYSNSARLNAGRRSSGGQAKVKLNRRGPAIDADTDSFIPSADGQLPPTVTVFKSDITYSECNNTANVVEMLRQEPLTFALQPNLHVHVKIINMDCCVNKTAWCFSTEGMMAVGQDELVLLIEYMDNEAVVPKDVLVHLNNIYADAKKGSTITEHGVSLHTTSTNFLDSKNHIGFLYIKPTFQCLQNVIVPKEPYLIGILVHRWEMPWAKIFPLRLVLRLGAEYRYYPSPIISTRHRESVFVEIGHTIINLLADFRNYSYTLPNIRGLTIHMEGKNTVVTIPSNRYDQVMKCINNSSDHILAFGGNFSSTADSHLVCIQDTQGSDENTYTTHAININTKPRKGGAFVTGASFIVFNGALKSSSGLTAKSSIVEDGLMIQIPHEQLLQIRESLRNMKPFAIQCGCINATSDETVNIVWGENDVNFNSGIVSAIDGQPLHGVPSIRAHNGKDYVCNSGSRMIRWTEVFILQNGEDGTHGQDVDFSKIAENISKGTCHALVKYLDLLSSNNFYKIGIRATLHVESVSYSAGSNGMKLPPIYMKSLDNELIPVLHRIISNNFGDSTVVLELVFRILNV